MPAIKKKWIKASQDNSDVVDENDTEETVEDEDKQTDVTDTNTAHASTKKPKKRPAQTPQAHILKGLDGEVLMEKRKRFIPPAELKLADWLNDNLEKRTEETLHLPHLYNYYTELCQADGSDILDIPEFNRMVKEKFGKAFGVKETSVYKSLIKERKINHEKKKAGLGGIRMKDIVHEAINHFKNPWSGVRFFTLKQYLATKYPALRLDQKPKTLKRALEMGVQYGQIDLVKGIGMAGYYKLPGGEPPPPKRKEKKEEDGEEKDKEKDSESAEEDKEPKEDKEEKTEEAAENGDKKEDESEVKKKRHRQKKVEKVSYSKMRHGQPEKIEDTFPLAITYQSAPKAVAITRIRKYIQEKYGETVQDTRWRKAIESGVDKGFWEYVSGSGIAGKLHLLMDDFNPDSEQIEDRICAAIIACHEPKAASANQIKKYISQYHPDFNVDERPDKFKKALQRAVAKNMIMQLSGLGASGSFQLTGPFIPSPIVLAGEDDSDADDEAYDSDEPVYIPKGTKSRGMPKVKTMEVVHSPPSKSKKAKPAKKEAEPSRAKPKKEDEKQPEGRASRGKKAPPKKAANKPKADTRKKSQDLSDDEEEEEEEEEEAEEDEPEYTPRKSQSRGGAPPAQSPKVVKKGKKKPTKQTKKKAEKEEEPEVSDTEEPEAKSKETKKPPAKRPAPQRAAGKAKKPAAEKSPAKKPKKDVSEDEEEDDTELIVEYTPRKSKSRGGEAEKVADSRKSKSRGGGGDADNEGEVAEYTPRKSKSRGGGTESDEVETAEPELPSRKSKSGGEASKLKGDSTEKVAPSSDKKSKGKSRSRKRF